MLRMDKKLPVTMFLLVFSDLIAICGLGIGGLLMVLKFKITGYFILGFLVLVISLILAALIRMVAVIGQTIFEIKTEAQLQNSILNKNFTAIKGNFDQMNQNVQEIKTFFERIEKHLDLKE